VLRNPLRTSYLKLRQAVAMPPDKLTHHLITSFLRAVQSEADDEKCEAESDSLSLEIASNLA
jgi:hypothetical protein